MIPTIITVKHHRDANFTVALVSEQTTKAKGAQSWVDLLPMKPAIYLLL